MRLRVGRGRWHRSEHERFGRLRYIMYAYVRGNVVHGLAPRVRAVWHAGFLLYDAEICGSCGRPVGHATGSWWRAPDALWRLVYGPVFNGVRCPHCFTRDARQIGIQLWWAPRVDR